VEQGRRTEAALEARLSRALAAKDAWDIRYLSMLLAYLHEARGEHRAADRLWSSLEENPQPKVVDRSGSR
jgi:hypothetical protein